MKIEKQARRFVFRVPEMKHVINDFFFFLYRNKETKIRKNERERENFK